MNVIRATINKKSIRGKRGKFRSIPGAFNTYLPRTSRQQECNKSLSSSNFSSVQPCDGNPGKVLGTADRQSSSSFSTEPVLTTPCKSTSKEPQITNPFVADAFRTPIVPGTTNSSTSRLSSSHHRKIAQCLPPPSSSGGAHKSRSVSSSGARPLTTSHSSHSRTPRTPKTTTSTLESSHHMTVAITEGRGLARGEVGLAAMDIYRPHLILCQISDSQTYINTLTKVNIIRPVEILVPNTFVENQPESKLFTLLHDTFSQVTITTVQRRYFSDNAGLQQVQALCLPEYASVELVVSHKFYALAAASALLKFTEYMKNVIFSPKSLKIEYQCPENVMAIDMQTAQKLELVMSRSGNGGEGDGSLLNVLDHCCTASGKRSLRANLLQPPTSLATINSRLLSVTELTQSPTFLHVLQSAVSKFLDVEQLLWLSVQLPNLRDEQRVSELQTNYVLLLKTSLDSLPALRESLQSAQTPYFRKVLNDLDDERFPLLLTTILEVINEDARTKKGFAASQFQRCFAIKTGVNGLLDMARASYSDLVSTMHERVQEMAEEFSLPLKANTTGNKGFHIQLKINKNITFSANNLPPVFIQVNRIRNLITCTTEELVVLNHRMKQVLQEVQIMSNSIMQELMRKLRVHIGCLYRLCENIAELDLLVAFALVSSADKFVPPTFGNKMVLKNSRHPILDFINPSTPVANDVFASSEKNFQIITGPNMGGKSIYIKQVALLQIMAQIGCFVPADSAEFRITKHILSRMGFDDSIEYNASSFVLEIQEMQYILRSVGPQCLVVIDELCRSTDYEEGTAIAWVLCEQLLQTKAFTFFTTHYLCLSKLQTLYPNVTNYQMVADDTSDGRLMYTHVLAPGVTRVMLYGLRLAQITCLPESVLQRAQEICHNMEENKLVEPIYYEGKTEAEEDQEYIEELFSLIQNDKFDLNEVKKVQHKLKLQYNIEIDQEQLGGTAPFVVDNEHENNKSGGDEFVDHPTNHEKQHTNHITEQSEPGADEVSPLNIDNRTKSTPAQYLLTPQREQSIIYERAQSICSLNKNTDLSPIRKIHMTPMISIKPNTPRSVVSKHSQHLKMSAVQNSHLPRTPQISKFVVEDSPVRSCRKSNQFVENDVESFNFQPNQRASGTNSSISNQRLPFVQHSLSQSSFRHSTEALSQHSYKSEITTNSTEFNYRPLQASSTMCDVTQTLSRPANPGKNLRTKMRRLDEKSSNEMSPSMLLGENEEVWLSEHEGEDQCHMYSPLLTPLRSTASRVSDSKQKLSGSHSSMVCHLSPDFKRISRTIDNRVTSYENDDDDSF